MSYYFWNNQWSADTQASKQFMFARLFSTRKRIWFEGKRSFHQTNKQTSFSSMSLCLLSFSFISLTSQGKIWYVITWEDSYSLSIHMASSPSEKDHNRYVRRNTFSPNPFSYHQMMQIFKQYKSNKSFHHLIYRFHIDRLIESLLFLIISSVEL